MFEESTRAETDFITEIARRAGCGLLLDVNNVHVACTNQLWDPQRYIDDFPLAHVQEIHVARHTRETDDKGRLLLIDTHDKFIDELVWTFFRRVIKHIGPIPTLIEWGANIPPWHELATEAVMADALMGMPEAKEVRRAAVD